MNDLEKYLKKPKDTPVEHKGRYEIYNLKDNPFPVSPFVNQDDKDKRYNGDIYEPSIRQVEFETAKQNFLAVSQTNPSHLRLGYIMDTSYIGRGNGKSAFLVNLQKKINSDFCLTLSDGHNKCFALTVSPEPGGRTKTFYSFVDLLANGIFKSNAIDDSLATLRLEALLELNPEFEVGSHFSDANELRQKLNSENWYAEEKIDFRKINELVMSSRYLSGLPKDFPLRGAFLLPEVVKTKHFQEYYDVVLKRGKPRIEFVFSHLVSLFLAAGFNGAYIFVDDFERIPDFQSERQKRDFALELRSCLFDGSYRNAKFGFYVFC